MSSTLDETANTESAQTDVKKKRIVYSWIIKNFSSLPEPRGIKICSPWFHGEQWRLLFYPRGGWDDKPKDDNYVSLYLQSNSIKKRIEVCVEMKILKSNKLLRESSFTHEYSVLDEFWGYPLFMNRSELLTTNSSDDNQFTIICIIDIPLNSVTSSFKTAIFDTKKSGLIDDYRLLFEKPIFSDFTVIVGNKKFQAHKNILAARCPVFAAMFEHKELEENRKNELKITNIEPAVIHGMLEFLYTDQVTDIKELAGGLLAAADKYELDGLRAMCEEELYEGLDKNNAAEILQLAELHRANTLKKCVMQFIVNHAREVVKSDNWKMAGWNLELLLEVIDELVLQGNVDSEESHSLEK